MINLVEQFIRSNSWIAVVSLVSLVAWVLWKSRRVKSFRRASLANRQIHNVVGTLVFVVAVLSINALANTRYGDADATGILNTLDLITSLTVYLALCIAVARAIELFWVANSSFFEEGHIAGLPRVLLFGAAIVLGLTVFGSNHGLSINSVYLSTGAMAAVLAFAMQRTLGDLFSGISLSIERPFKIGDWIELEDGTRGEVRDLNWRATRLRDWDNSTLVVPNGKLAAQAFRNLHDAEHQYSPMYTVYLPAEIDPRFAKSLMLEVALKCERVSKSQLPSVRLADAGSIPYRYMVWLHFPNYPAMFAGREEFFRNLHFALKKAGIQTAPTAQDVRFLPAEKPEAKQPSELSVLRGLDFTELFDDAEMDMLVSRSYSAFFDAGTDILAEGETSASVYIVVNGIVETSVTDMDGDKRSLKPLQAGEYFGLASMLTDAPSFQTFSALSDVALVQVDRKCFKDIVSRREELLHGFAELVETRMAQAEKLKNQSGKLTSPSGIFDVLRRIERILSS